MTKPKLDYMEYLNELSEDDLKLITGGANVGVEVDGDVASLKFSGKSVPLPPAKSKKLIDGGYAGKTVTFNIEPKDRSSKKQQ